METEERGADKGWGGLIKSRLMFWTRDEFTCVEVAENPIDGKTDCRNVPDRSCRAGALLI